MSTPSSEHYRRSAGQVHPRLAVEGLRPPCLQFALLPDDPLARFREHLLRHPLPDFGEIPHSGSARQLSPRQAYLSGTWMTAFHSVTGDQVHLLIDDREVTQLPPDASGEIKVVTSATFMTVSSNEPSGVRWFATRPVLHKGRAIVWSLRLSTQTGKIDAVVLTEDNALDLEMISGV